MPRASMSGGGNTQGHHEDHHGARDADDIPVSARGHLPVLDDGALLVLRSSCVGMALNRIEGPENLYVGG